MPSNAKKTRRKASSSELFCNDRSWTGVADRPMEFSGHSRRLSNESEEIINSSRAKILFKQSRLHLIIEKSEDLGHNMFQPP